MPCRRRHALSLQTWRRGPLSSCQVPAPLLQVLSWPQVFFEAHPVVLALRNLFHQLQGQERAAVGAAALPRPAAVDPAELRLALASSSDRTFGVGRWLG